MTATFSMREAERSYWELLDRRSGEDRRSVDRGTPERRVEPKEPEA
jgi:hypothetical protein